MPCPRALTARMNTAESNKIGRGFIRVGLLWPAKAGVRRGSTREVSTKFNQRTVSALLSFQAVPTLHVLHRLIFLSGAYLILEPTGRRYRDKIQSNPREMMRNLNLSELAKTRPPEAIVEREIQIRAYELYVERGKAQGLALKDWLEAEAEVLARSDRF